jgi:hypothetical protein
MPRTAEKMAYERNTVRPCGDEEISYTHIQPKFAEGIFSYFYNCRKEKAKDRDWILGRLFLGTSLIGF